MENEFTIKFSKKVMAILNELSAKDKVSKAEILRRSLGVYYYVHTEVMEKSNRQLIVYENGQKLKEVVLEL